MKEREGGSALHASLLLDGEERILEGNRDAEVFLEKPLEQVRKVPLQQANPSLHAALKELLAKTRRGRGVEDYALAYKVGKRLMRLNISIAPYPLEALGATGSLVTITTPGPRYVPEKREPVAAEGAPPPVKAVKGDIREFLDGLPEPAFLLDRESVCVYVNQAMCDAVGHGEEDLLGRPLSFFLAREKAKKALDYLPEAVHAAPWRGELEFSREDGSTSFVAVTVSFLGEGEEALLLGLGRECTAEARINRERDGELKRVWSLLEDAEAALVCFTPDLRVTLISHSAEELLRTTRDRAIGTPLPDLFPAAAREEVAALLQRVVAGERVEGVELRIGERKEVRVLSLQGKPAREARGRKREFMLLVREVTGEDSAVTAMEGLLEESRRRERILGAAVRSTGVDDFLEGCLALLEEELACTSSAAFLVEEGSASLRAWRNLSGEERGVLRALGLRPGYARVCQGLRVLTVTVRGGVPREGWDEVISCVEKPDALVPVLRERRWRSLTVIPLRGGEGVAGFFVLADCDAEKTAGVGEHSLASMGETAAGVLASLQERISREEEEKEAGGGGAPGTGTAAPQDPREDVAEPAGTGAAGALAEARDLEAAREEHDYFEIARRLKGHEEAVDALPLWSQEAPDRAVPSARGIDLGALLVDLKEYYSRRRPGSNIFLELDEDIPLVHTDKKMLREALMCLLDNALKFSPRGSPVILGAERWGDEVLLRVEDQGPGIPPEVVRQVMQEGGGGEGRGRRAKSLVVCRDFVKAMGGELTLKGKGGEGTTAYIRLRLLPFLRDVR
ncbi:MAG: PAS domain-containing protein [Actinobacteria bacterium]|nr:PAS domain-containing protein [Actinomycetota bacterium]